MNWLWWIAGLAVGSWLILGMLFLGFPTVEKLKERRDEIPLGFIAITPIYLALVLGVLADVIFNWTWGTVIFRELPREFVFTERLKRHWRGDSRIMRRRAEPWVLLVNMIDPNHVRPH